MRLSSSQPGPPYVLVTLTQHTDAMALAARSYHDHPSVLSVKTKSLLKGILLSLPREDHHGRGGTRSQDEIPKTISFIKRIDQGKGNDSQNSGLTGFLGFKSLTFHPKAQSCVEDNVEEDSFQDEEDPY